MLQSRFGTNKRLYDVYQKTDGSIEVHVFTENEEARHIIENHSTDPMFFVQNQREYSKSNIAAKKWLARVVTKYMEYFVAGNVTFVMRSFHEVKSTFTFSEPIIENSSVPSDKPIDNKNNYLIEYGFQLAGSWTVHPIKDGIRFALEKFAEDRVIYAFVIDNECKYIGVCDNSNTTLKDRMRRYQQMVGGGTNERINLLIKECLAQGRVATIWVIKPYKDLDYKGVKVDLVKGLENPLIQKLNPEWNIKG